MHSDDTAYEQAPQVWLLLARWLHFPAAADAMAACDLPSVRFAAALPPADDLSCAGANLQGPPRWNVI